jgi:uncharacterized protein
MKSNLKQFSIPIKGLKQSFYQFDFQLDKSFFSAFEESVITDGDIDVKMELHRKTSHLELNFDFEGTIKSECDRCLVGIDLPVEGQNRIIVKFAEDQQEDEDEIIYIHPEAHELKVAHYIYEYVTLAVPMRKVYDCENDENPPCDETMLSYLSSNVSEDEIDFFGNDTDADNDSDDNDNNNGDGNPFWDSLKDLKL